MDLDEIKRGLRAEIKKRENETYSTFQCNVRQMCKDVLSKIEEQEDEISGLNVRIKRQDYRNCLVMAECRDAQSRWCYQAACTLPPGVTATLYGKPVMVEPKRLFRRSERLLLASTLWKQRAGRLSGVADDR